MDKANTATVSSEYVYLMDPNGEIIYHPKQELIRMGRFSGKQSGGSRMRQDESWKEMFRRRSSGLLQQKTISYTGWKLVSVVPLESFGMGQDSTRYLVIMLVSLCASGRRSFSESVCLGADIAKPLRQAK